jgi:hypothetical protein
MQQIGLLAGLFAVLTSNRRESFKDGWRRLQHMRHGHNPDNSTRIDKLHSENYPCSDKNYVYTVNVMRCNDCGLHYHDSGFEPRNEAVSRITQPSVPL